MKKNNINIKKDLIKKYSELFLESFYVLNKMSCNNSLPLDIRRRMIPQMHEAHLYLRDLLINEEK